MPPNNTALKPAKQKLQREIDKSTITVRVLNIPLSVTDRSSRPKKKKKIEQ